MDARAVLHRIGWRPAIAAVLLILAAELATVLVMVNSDDARWQRCYGTRSEPVGREGCPTAVSVEDASAVGPPGTGR